MLNTQNTENEVTCISNFGKRSVEPVQEEFDERMARAQEIVKDFPVTRDMFPLINFQQTWTVCK